jgi:hypothetical protein
LTASGAASIISDVEFVPFSAKDFDAYLENKWQSHVFNRERLEVKEKLLALGRSLSPRMVTEGGALLTYEVSVEHPALWNQQRVQNQHLFFSRSQEARKEIDSIIDQKRSMASMIEDPSPLRNHIFISVMIDKSQVEFGLKLHSDATVDRDNLQRKCQEYFQREKLLHLLQELPESHLVGIEGQEARTASDLDDGALQGLIQELPSANSWLAVRRCLSRDDPMALQPELVDLAQETMARLLPIMDFIAWRRENDFVSMRDTLKQKEVRQRSKGLAKNDRVRVIRGMFTGKTGVIQETDAKGGLKVLLGSMVAKLKGEDVTKL